MVSVGVIGPIVYIYIYVGPRLNPMTSSGLRMGKRYHKSLR